MRWLGYDWGEQPVLRLGLFRAALRVGRGARQRDGKAYVDDLSADEIREHRGTLTEPGRNSPWRDRSADENLDLFRRMRAGEFENGARVLRAKHRHGLAQHQPARPDPVPHRPRQPIRGPATRGASTRPTTSPTARATRSRASPTRCARSSSRRIGRSTTGSSTTCPCRRKPRQIEFARLNLTLHRPVQALPAQARHRGPRPRLGRSAHAHHLGLRRRGFPAEGIRDFATVVGVAKADNIIEIGQLEYAVRNVLNRVAPRRFGVLDPLKVVIDNYPEGQTEIVRACPTTQRIPMRASRDVAVLARAVDRARRLHGGAGAQVLPPRARSRGSPARRLLRHLQFGRQGRRGQGRRAALHLRPGYARRRCSRWPATQGHARTGSPPRTRCRPRFACTTTCSRPRLRAQTAT